MGTGRAKPRAKTKHKLQAQVLERIAKKSGHLRTYLTHWWHQSDPMTRAGHMDDAPKCMFAIENAQETLLVDLPHRFFVLSSL